MLRDRLLRVLDLEEAAGEAIPHALDETKRSQREPVVVLERKVDRAVLRRLRTRVPARVQQKLDAGQLPLWGGALRVPTLLPLARPKRRRFGRHL